VWVARGWWWQLDSEVVYRVNFTAMSAHARCDKVCRGAWQSVRMHFFQGPPRQILVSPATARQLELRPSNRTMSDERRPRQRFDSDDADKPVRSRFGTERRSRSPSRRESEPQPQRARSPVDRDATESPAAANKKALAAAAAARINALVNAKRGNKQVDVPPIRAVSCAWTLCRHVSLTTHQVFVPTVVKSPAAGAQAASSETYQQDGDFIKDIEINDLRNRYTLTKGAVQKRVNNFCR
jgi:hypothetical protein